MKKGFTLVELLVVISIIGILMALSLVAFSGAKKSARDGKRKADIEQIRSALEIYRTDCKTYPAIMPAAGGSLTGVEAACSGNVYMSVVPGDPNSAYKYSYVRTNANIYTLCAQLEISGTATTCGTNLCGTGFDCNYKTTNP